MMKTIEKLQRGEHAFIVCIGDSITEQNYHLYGKLNYVGQLTERLMEWSGRKSRVLNAGSSGDTSWGVLDRLERDALRFTPDLVTVMLGINDSQRGMEQLPAFKRNLETIISQIRDTGSEVLLLSQNRLDYGINEDAVTARVCYPFYAEAFREVAQAEQAPLCDIYQAWGDHIGGSLGTHLMHMNDGLHPNDRGHNFMAKVLFDYLQIPN